MTKIGTTVPGKKKKKTQFLIGYLKLNNKSTSREGGKATTNSFCLLESVLSSSGATGRSNLDKDTFITAQIYLIFFAFSCGREIVVFGSNF